MMKYHTSIFRGSIFDVRYSLFLLLCLLLAAAPGCGRKTMPVPPQAAAPVAITDLRYSLQKDEAELTWSYPRKLAGGAKLSEIESFRLWRAEVKAEDSCAGCPLPYTAIAVAGGALPGDGPTRIARYQDAGLRQGYHYYYKVQASVDGSVFGPDSNTIDFIWK